MVRSKLNMFEHVGGGGGLGPGGPCMVRGARPGPCMGTPPSEQTDWQT